MEFSKKTLLRILEEVKSTDVDEMAAKRPKRVQKMTRFKDGPYKGQIKPPKILNLWGPNNPTLPGERGTPDGFIWNLNQIPGESRLLIPYTCDNLQKFMEDNREWLEQIGAEHQITIQDSDFCRVPRMLDDSPWVHPETDEPIRKALMTGKKHPPKTINVTKFNAILNEEFGEGTSKGDEFSEILSKRAIPCISLDLPYQDRHSEFYNENEMKIFWRTHSYNMFKTATEFLMSVISRVDPEKFRAKGIDVPKPECIHLARQYNKEYRNWEETKKSEQKYEGITPSYKLFRRGFEENNIDILLKMEFTIEGKRIGNEWRWEISMVNRFGNKKPDEKRIKSLGDMSVKLTDQGYLDEKVLRIEKSVPFPQDKDYKVNAIMNNLDISESLRQAIYDFKQLIKSIDPKSALKYANVTRQSLGLSEQIIRKIKNTEK